MSRARGAVAALVAMAGLLMGGCGSGSGGSAAPQAGDASKVDMCTVLSDADLAQLGINLSSRKPENLLGVVGCQWIGNPIRLRLERNEDSIAKYLTRRNDPAFSSFRENTVNGRAGIQLSVSDSGDQCVQLMDGGPVSLAVGVGQSGRYDGPPIDPCAEASRIAQMIEPRLPKVGT